jgi:hypothetical protein
MGARTKMASFLISLGVVAVLAATAGPASSAVTLDQSQTTDGGWQSSGLICGSGGALAQPFTAARSGSLVQVDVFAGPYQASPGDLQVQIETTTGGMPSGNVLATAAVHPTGLPAGGTWISVPLNQPAPSQAGTTYAIMLSSPTTKCLTGSGAEPTWHTWQWEGGPPDQSGRNALTGPWQTAPTWHPFGDGHYPPTNFLFKTHVMTYLQQPPPSCCRVF